MGCPSTAGSQSPKLDGASSLRIVSLLGVTIPGSERTASVSAGTTENVEILQGTAGRKTRELAEHSVKL